MDKIIKSFINLVIEQKKLQFSSTENDFDKILIEKNILKLENNKISISNFELVSTYFVEKYKEKLNFKISEDFYTNTLLINKIKEDFTSNNYIQEYNILEKEIWKFVIKESNSEFKCTFNKFLNSIDVENKSDGIFNFVEAYSAVLPKLDLSDCIIFENTLILIEITKSNADYNFPLGSVLNGIKNKCKVDYNSGKKLLEKSLNVSEEKEKIISAIVSGLYKNKKIEFYNSILDNLIQKEIKINAIFFGLSDFSEIEDIECEIFIKLINDYKKKDFLIISILSLAFSILKSNNLKYHNLCFNELESAIENEKAAYYILNNLNQLNNYNQEKTRIILKLINQDYFTIEKYINSISSVFLELKEFDYFKEIILEIIKIKPFESFIKNFQSCFHSVDKIEIDKFIIELLTDNQACRRATALNIFNQLSDYNPYKFSFNILELPYISQYKLLLYLTQDFHEPKKILIALLPLIDSKSQFIRESFLCKLEEISEDYGGHVTKILEDNLDKNNLNYSLAIERIKMYIEDYYSKNADIKNSVLELNPYYTHYKNIKKFNELFSKKMSESVDRGAKENSFLSIFSANTVQLSKSGGWRIGTNKEISPLGKFATSFLMPRSYFINPNEYELKKGFLSRQNWIDEDFLSIKNFLKNE